MNERIFSGVYPTGIIWFDRLRENNGNYKKLASLNLDTLKLKIEKSCPKKLIPFIQDDAAIYQDK